MPTRMPGQALPSLSSLVAYRPLALLLDYTATYISISIDQPNIIRVESYLTDPDPVLTLCCWISGVWATLMDHAAVVFRSFEAMH
jgi:hypothetical protein